MTTEQFRKEKDEYAKIGVNLSIENNKMFVSIYENEDKGAGAQIQKVTLDGGETLTHKAFVLENDIMNDFNCEGCTLENSFGDNSEYIMKFDVSII